MYQPSRQLASFHVAGFKYWDGILVLDQLKPGTPLSLVPERDNPYDPNAVALYHGTAKLGYVPRAINSELATLCFFGHAGIFECRVLQANPDEEPWKQVLVGLYVLDGRRPTGESADDRADGVSVSISIGSDAR